MECLIVFWLNVLHFVYVKFIGVFLSNFFQLMDINFLEFSILKSFLVQSFALCGHKVCYSFLFKLPTWSFDLVDMKVVRIFQLNFFHFFDLINCLFQEF